MDEMANPKEKKKKVGGGMRQTQKEEEKGGGEGREENSCETSEGLYLQLNGTKFLFYLVYKLVLSNALKGKIPKPWCWVWSHLSS